MSLYCLTCGQCFARTFLGNSSMSQNATVSKPPVASIPRENPPMPLNRSKCLSLVSITIPLCIWIAPVFLSGVAIKYVTAITVEMIFGIFNGCILLTKMSLAFIFFFRLHQYTSSVSLKSLSFSSYSVS